MITRVAVCALVLLSWAAPLRADDGAGSAASAKPVLAHHEQRACGPLTVTYDVTPLDPPLGHPFQLKFTVEIDDAPATPATGMGRVVVEWPDLAKELTKALGESTVAVEPFRARSDQRELTADARFFDSGTFTLPPLTVSLRGAPGVDEPVSVTFEGPQITVPSVLAALPPEDVKPLAGRDVLPLPLRAGDEPGFPWLPVGAALAVLALLATAIALLLKRRAAVEPATPPPPPPAHERALRALDALLSRHLPEQGAVEPYFVELSEILRRYIEDRFGLRAPERTTEEFLAELRNSDAGRRALEAAQRDVLRGFLERADLVKFARDEPDLDVCAQAAGAARDFVRGTAAPCAGGPT